MKCVVFIFGVIVIVLVLIVVFVIVKSGGGYCGEWVSFE